MLISELAALEPELLEEEEEESLAELVTCLLGLVTCLLVTCLLGSLNNLDFVYVRKVLVEY